MTLVTANKVDGLTPRQAMFAREYLVDRNATQAAIRSGFSVNSAKQLGSRLLTYVDVKQEIQRLQELQETETRVDQNFVIRGLQEIALHGEQESNRVRSYELLGKHLRMFVDVSESTVHHDVRELQAHSLSDLKRMIAAMDEPAALPVHVEPAADAESPQTTE